MSRRAPREVELFNFSFLDILATTIGAILFLLIVLVLDTSGMIEAGQLAADDAAIRRDVARVQDELAAARRDLRDRRARASAEEVATAGLREEVAGLRVRLERLRAETEAAPGEEAQRLDAELADVERETAQARDDLAAIRERPATTRVVDLRQARNPRVRATEKQPLHVECTAEAVTVLRPGDRRGNEMIMVREPTRAADLADPGCPLRRILADQERFDPSRSYVLFFVRPDGQESFLRARELVWSLGARFELGWRPLSKDEPLRFFFGSGGGSPDGVQ